MSFGGGSSPLLRIYFVGNNGDPTMVVHDPYGNFYCVDDSFGTVNPTIDFDSPGGGTYDVWLGSYAIGTSLSSTLYLTENSGNYPSRGRRARERGRASPAPSRDDGLLDAEGARHGNETGAELTTKTPANVPVSAVPPRNHAPGTRADGAPPFPPTQPKAPPRSRSGSSSRSQQGAVGR